MYGPMTRTLLEDRLHLKLHDEVRKLPVYDLTSTVLKEGTKAETETVIGSCVPIDLQGLSSSLRRRPTTADGIP